MWGQECTANKSVWEWHYECDKTGLLDDTFEWEQKVLYGDGIMDVSENGSEGIMNVSRNDSKGIMNVAESSSNGIMDVTKTDLLGDTFEWGAQGELSILPL